MEIVKDDRFGRLCCWVRDDLGYSDKGIQPASGDASFRRYFRIQTDTGSKIIMDAPPDKEDSEPFVRIAAAFNKIGLNVPIVEAQNISQGFYLLSDLGCETYLDLLNADSADQLYRDAITALLLIQLRGPSGDALPLYDANLLHAEMGLFSEWYLAQHLGLTLSEMQQHELKSQYEILAASALEQPQLCVHRDYHSRNLMRTEVNNPGILDFQDAVTGPITYDLVSLLRDCYIRWPRTRVESWAKGYFELALKSGLFQSEHETVFMRWFDWMGVQRHLKAIGIFARLNYRDSKSGYLKDIPRTLQYVQEVSADYAELEPLHRLVSSL